MSSARSILRRAGSSRVRALGAALLVLPAAAMADEPACQTHTDIARALAQGFGETREAVGLASTGHLIEIFASADGDTWTLVLTDVDGTSCILAEGEAWVRSPQLPADHSAAFVAP